VAQGYRCPGRPDPTSQPSLSAFDGPWRSGRDHSATSACSVHDHHARAWLVCAARRRLTGDPMVMRFTIRPTPRLKLHAATPTPRQKRGEVGPHRSSGRGSGNLTAPREEDGIRLEMESGKRSFSCRGEREMLGTHFDSLLVWGSGKGGAHRRPVGGRCVIRDGG
jgi:hypothetical protein